MFQGEPEFFGSVATVGALTEAYIANTTSLRKANNKINTICIAAQRCVNEG